MAKKPETILQQEIRAALESLVGGKWWKVHGGPFQEAGVPDLCGCAFGFYFAIEVKTPEDRRGATELQLEHIQDIRDNGGCAFVTSSPPAAVRKVINYLKHAPTSSQHRGFIDETLKVLALRASSQSSQARSKQRIIRVLDGAGNREDDYSPKGNRRPVAKKWDPDGPRRLPKKRSRKLASTD